DDPILRDLYLGEWRRFAPHRAGLGVLVEYFRAILPEHEAAITARVADDGPAIREWLSALHAPLTAEPTRPFRLLMVGDCLMGEVQTFLRSAAAARGVSCDFRYSYFSSLMGDEIEAGGVRAAIAGGVAAIAVSYLSYQGIPPYRSLLEGADTATEADTAALGSGIADFVSSHL